METSEVCKTDLVKFCSLFAPEGSIWRFCNIFAPLTSSGGGLASRCVPTTSSHFHSTRYNSSKSKPFIIINFFCGEKKNVFTVPHFTGSLKLTVRFFGAGIRVKHGFGLIAFNIHRGQRTFSDMLANDLQSQRVLQLPFSVANRSQNDSF